MTRRLTVMVISALFVALAGCTSTAFHPGGAVAPVVYQSDSTPTPSWVFGPSAPLPEGFHKPGPVGQILIKEYPVCRIAVAQRNAQHQNSGALFMPLFHHIESAHIAMSSPVVMAYQETAKNRVVMSSMAFVYPTPATGQLENNGLVHVISVPAMMVVSIGARGSYTRSRFLKATGKLDLWLAEHKSQFTVVGQPRYLAYNSPFVPPPFRYGEVQIPIHPVAATPAP